MDNTTVTYDVSVIFPGPNIPPDWIHTVTFTPKFYKDGFSRLSPGCKNISLNTIVRHRKGKLLWL